MHHVPVRHRLAPGPGPLDRSHPRHDQSGPSRRLSRRCRREPDAWGAGRIRTGIRRDHPHGASCGRLYGKPDRQVRPEGCSRCGRPAWQTGRNNKQAHGAGGHTRPARGSWAPCGTPFCRTARCHPDTQTVRQLNRQQHVLSCSCCTASATAEPITQKEPPHQAGALFIACVGQTVSRPDRLRARWRRPADWRPCSPWPRCPLPAHSRARPA